MLDKSHGASNLDTADYAFPVTPLLYQVRWMGHISLDFFPIIVITLHTEQKPKEKGKVKGS